MKNIFLASMLLPCAAAMAQTSASSHFDWNGATVYFVITDRFCNGDPSNDVNYGRIVDYG